MVVDEEERLCRCNRKHVFGENKEEEHTLPPVVFSVTAVEEGKCVSGVPDINCYKCHHLHVKACVSELKIFHHVG